MTATGPAHQKAAVESVHFPLWRYNPDAEGKKLTWATSLPASRPSPLNRPRSAMRPGLPFPVPHSPNMV